MDEVLGVRPFASSNEEFGLVMQDEFSLTPSEKRTANASFESIQDSLGLPDKIRVFLRMRSLAPKFKVKSQDPNEIFFVLNATNLITKIPIAIGTNSRRSKQPNSVETQNIRNYTFTSIFTPEVSQSELFESTKQNIAEFIAGQSSTIMAYGTTNSGKTYTLFGTNTSPGIIPNSINYLFSNINSTASPWYKPIHGNNLISLNEEDRIVEVDVKEKLLSCRSISQTESLESFIKLVETNSREESSSDGFFYSVWLSFIEIYNETIFDLLTLDNEGKNMQLKLVSDKKGNTCLKDLRIVSVNTALEAFQIMMAGKSRLNVASTAMNSKSSRSHAIFTITLMKYCKESTPEEVTTSTLTFCDLAGTGGLRKNLDSQRVKEARSINASLLVLGRCLKSVQERQTSRPNLQISGPFRESNLTRFFHKALSGKENITLLVNVNPSPELYVETQSVLNFSSLAKKVNMESSKQLKKSTDSQLTARSSRRETPSIPQTPVKIQIYQRNFDDLKEQNQLLLEELSTLKNLSLDKEYEIRDELTQHYSKMIKDMEESWKRKHEEIEEEQEDLLKWSVNQVEVFYKERIDNITNRKRRRLSNGDGDFERTIVETLEAENAEATSKIISQRETIENLRKNNQELKVQKSELLFQLAVAKKESKELRDGRRMNESVNTEEDDNSLNRRRESFLFEFNEYWTKTSDLEEQLKEKEDWIQKLQDEVIDKDEELSEIRDKWQKAEARAMIITRKVEELEAKLIDLSSTSIGRPLEDRIIASSNVKISDGSSPDSMYKISMIEAESSLLEDYGTPDVCLKTLVRVPALIPFDMSENSKLSFPDSLAENSIKGGPRSSEGTGKDDSGIMTSSGSQRSSELNKVETEDKSSQMDIVETDDKCSQVNIIQEEDIERIRERLESLKLEYGKLRNEYSSESSKVMKLEVELSNVKKSVIGLENSSEVAEYESKLAAKDEELERLNKDKNEIQIKYNEIYNTLELKSLEYEKTLDELHSSLKMKMENESRASTNSASLENQLAVARSQLEKTNIKCSSEHVPEINKLEKELFEKTLRITELEGRMCEDDKDLTRISELGEKVREFEELMDKCLREKEELRKQLHERSEFQQSLDSKLKNLIWKIQERESEVQYLKTTLEQTKSVNNINSEKARELSKDISESLLKMGSIKSELIWSEETRQKLERVSTEEVSFLRSKLSTFEKQDAFLSLICEKNESKEEEVNRLKLELCEKEREMNLFKRNRDATIEKYESLVRQLQTEVDKGRQSRKLFPSRKASKELTRGISESLRSKIGKSESEGSLKFWKNFDAKPVLDERVFPHSVSSKFSSSAISSSLESIAKASEKSQPEKAAKKENQTESEPILEIVPSKVQEFYGNVDSNPGTTFGRISDTESSLASRNSGRWKQ